MRPGAPVGYVQATRTSLPRCARTGRAGRPAPRAPRTVRTGYAYQPRPYRTYRVPCVPRTGRTVRTVATQVVDWVIARITGQIFTEQVALAKRMRAEPGRSAHVRAVEADPSFYEGWLAPRLARAALRAEC